MHDSLSYFKRPPIFRRFHQNEITFSMVYAFSEKFMLPLSHDEVVHMKASILYKMPGEEQQKFANLRALYGLQWTHPGSQLIFMGDELGQTSEWSHDLGVAWHLLEFDLHRGVQAWVAALNALYTSRKALYHNAFREEGYEWISGDDVQNSVLAYLRKGESGDKVLLVICHFNTNYMEQYSVGVPYGGTWTEVLNSDDTRFGGSGLLNGALTAEKKTLHGRSHSITFQLPPLCVMVFEGEDVPKVKKAAAPAAKAKAKKS